MNKDDSVRCQSVRSIARHTCCGGLCSDHLCGKAAAFVIAANRGSVD